MAEEYTDRTAAIAYYTGGSDPFYTTEGNNRWRQYPPPYWYLGTWYYAWPWLWLDGNKHPGWQDENWESHLLNRLPVPSDLVIDMDGLYISDTRQGTVDISIYNEATTPLTGTLQCVLTESGLYYHAPNGVDWHHHVMRDMIPNETGTPVTLPAGEEMQVSLDFMISADWDDTQCELVCFVQHEYLQPDSTKEIWQGAKVSIPDITLPSAGVEGSGEQAAATITLHGSKPNPGRPATEIAFDLPQACEVNLSVYDATGRRIITLVEGQCAAGSHTIPWRGINEAGSDVPSGMYFYRLRAGGTTHTRQLLIAR